MRRKKNRAGASKDLVKGTWETIGNSWVSNGSTVESDGLLTKAVVTSGNTPYSTYFTLIQGSFDNPQKSAASVAYADSNRNGSLDLKDDLVLGTATTKSLVDNPGGFSGTFSGSLKSNVVYSFIDGQRVGETTYDNSLWGGSASKPSTKRTKSSPSKAQTGQQGSKKNSGTTTSDPITGQLLTFSDLGTIENDKVYGKENYRWLQPILNNVGFTREGMDKITDFNIEFEFSKQYIAITMSVKNNSGDPVTGDWVGRRVLKGSFEYADSGLASATLEFIGWQNFAKESGSQIYQESGGFTKFANPTFKKIDSWSSIYDIMLKKVGFEVNKQGLPDVDSYGTPGGYLNINPAAAKERITQLGEGKFFYNGWEANPFNSNLI
jgi:hypothetical protein